MRGKAGMFVPRQVPATISGLSGWWDFSNGSTMFDATTGGSLVAADAAVARVEDLSGNTRHFTQATSASRPIRKTNIQNGRGTIRLNGSQHFMATSANLSTILPLAQCTVFAVAACASASNDAILDRNSCVLSSSSGGGRGYACFRSNNTAYALGYDTAYRSASLSYTIGTWGVFTTRHDGSTLLFRLNGGSDSSVSLATNAFSSGTAQLGNNAYGARLNGDVGEIIAYNVALSDADRNAVESYLQNKWGI